MLYVLGDIKKVMQQMFEGLFFIHNNKIIHRDMKAANILITRQVSLNLILCKKIEGYGFNLHFISRKKIQI